MTFCRSLVGAKGEITERTGVGSFHGNCGGQVVDERCQVTTVYFALEQASGDFALSPPLLTAVTT